MKKSEFTFMDGFTMKNPQIAEAIGNVQMVFDWDLAASIINKAVKTHPNLVAEAGLQRDWEHTGGEIFKNGKPVTDSYTFLCSNWAVPTLILSWDGKEQEELVCQTSEEGSRFDSGSKWDELSLEILNKK